jgi:osmoprotectant transport system permease protein
MSELLRGVPPLLASHLVLVLASLAIAIAIALPLAIVVAGRPRAAFATIAVASVIQTIPGLALLAVVVPVLAAIGWLRPFGFAPALIALTLYAMLPILRNTITGLRGVDAAAIEAASGMGMTSRQLLARVELPLAAPVIAAGVRTAAVWTVGTATLATPVGASCLGNYIFAGLQTRNFAMLGVGIAFAAALALVLDGLLALVEHALAGRRKGRVAVPLACFAALAIAVIGVAPRLVEPSRAVAASSSPARGAVAQLERVHIGGKTFTEQYVLVELMRQRLEAAGVSVDVVPSLGSTVIFDALVNGDLDAYVDYTGTLWTNAMKRPSDAPRWRVLAELDGWLAREHDVRALPPLGFENTYVLAMRRDTAERLGVHTLADLARHPEVSIGGDYEFFGRAEWTALRDSYGLSFARRATFDPALLYDALVRGEVDVISAFSSDGRIAAFDLVVLADPRGALPPYDALVLLGARAAGDARVSCALGMRVPIEAMRRANALVDREHDTPAAAATWLAAQLGPPPACGGVTP